MGKRINGPWQVFKAKVKYTIKVLVWIFILSGVVVGIAFMGGRFYPSIVYQKQEVILDNLTAKVNELKGTLVSEIKKCESAGASEDNGLITFDPSKTNKSVEPASIGSYQWKVKSIQYYYQKLYNRQIGGKEAILIALDSEKAGELTSRVIFETENGLSNWLNCSRKNGSAQKLAIINSLLN